MPINLFQDSELVVFDLDGTLVDTKPGNLAGTNTFLQRYGLEPVDGDWVRQYVMPSTLPRIIETMEQELGLRVDDLEQRLVSINNNCSLPEKTLLCTMVLVSCCSHCIMVGNGLLSQQTARTQRLYQALRQLQ